MTQNNKIDFDIKEQSRLVVTIAIIASIISIYAIPLSDGNALNTLRGVMIVPGASGFIYLVMTGSYLKYKKTKYIGELPIAKSIRTFFYDWMIDLFWMGLPAALIFGFASAFHWDINSYTGFISGLVIALLILTPIMIISLISWRKEQATEEKDR